MSSSAAVIVWAQVRLGVCPIEQCDFARGAASKIVKPRPTTATSIPGMLQLFQNEWDAVMLETYSLRKQLQKTREELSTSLYREDAAQRVIARLLKERDEARACVAPLPVSGSSPFMRRSVVRALGSAHRTRARAPPHCVSVRARVVRGPRRTPGPCPVPHHHTMPM